MILELKKFVEVLFTDLSFVKIFLTITWQAVWESGTLQKDGAKWKYPNLLKGIETTSSLEDSFEKNEAILIQKLIGSTNGLNSASGTSILNDVVLLTLLNISGGCLNIAFLFRYVHIATSFAVAFSVFFTEVLWKRPITKLYYLFLFNQNKEV